MKNNISKISSVLKHHDLIQIHSSLGANEQKIFNFIIFCIRYKRAKNGCIKTSHSEINKFVGKKLNSLQLQDNFTKMMEVVVQIGLLKYFPKNKKKIAKKKKWGLRHLVEKVDYDNGEIKIFLPSELVEMVLNYGQEYCMLNFQTINKFNSKYTIRLYENIMRYITPNNKYIQLPKMELTLFKRLMGITSQYKRFPHFKQKVIQVAIDEININTNIKVSYQLFKSGTKYTHIKIYGYFKAESRLIENTLTMLNKDINTFLYNYLPLYANNEVVASIDNNEIYFEKKSMKFIMKYLRGNTTLNHDTSLEVLNYCYENREGFEWFSELDFEQLLYESREKDRKDNYAQMQDTMIYGK